MIPAFNEEGTIADVLLQTENTLQELDIPFEVIVVDDGSRDKTKLLASSNGARLISYQVNRGKGYALRKGLANANGQILVTMDADGSHRPEELPRIIRPLLIGVDVVMGSRFLSEESTNVTSKLHVLGNRMFNFLITLLNKKRITDSQSGFRAFKREVFDGVRLSSEGYEIETELTIKSLRNGFVVREEPITCFKRTNGASKLRAFSDGLSILKTILRASLM